MNPVHITNPTQYYLIIKTQNSESHNYQQAIQPKEQMRIRKQMTDTDKPNTHPHPGTQTNSQVKQHLLLPKINKIREERHHT